MSASVCNSSLVTRRAQYFFTLKTLFIESMSHYTVPFQSGILHVLKAITHLACKTGSQATENMDWDLKRVI